MVAEITFPSGAPFFKGHFPGHPITPGVMLIDKAVSSAMKILGRNITLKCIKKVKFSNPVLPDEPVTLNLDVRGEGEIAYSYRMNDMQCASGVLIFE